MAQKTIKFSVNQLYFSNQSHMSSTDFSEIESEEMKPMLVNKGEPNEETLSVSRVIKNIIENRYVALYFLKGDKYPYPEKVIDRDLTEKANPRPPEQIELNDQLFVLVDTQKQRVYISDQRRRASVVNWIKNKVSKDIAVKAIIEESEFINKIKSIKSISFSVVPNLFNSASDSLPRHLVEDANGYGAQKAKLELFYGNSRLTDQIATKIGEVLKNKYEFEEITVIGNDDSEMESILNLDEITNTINVEATVDPVSKLFNNEEVFDSLIRKLS